MAGNIKNKFYVWSGDYHVTENRGEYICPAKIAEVNFKDRRWCFHWNRTRGTLPQWFQLTKDDEAIFTSRGYRELSDSEVFLWNL